MPNKKQSTLQQKVIENGSMRIEILIAIVGFLLSIALHELLHIVLHWHQIVGLRFFPNIYTVTEVVVSLPEQYDLATEEFIGYTITAGVLIITAIIIVKVHDKNDTRTARQILFPNQAKVRTAPNTKQKAKRK